MLRRFRQNRRVSESTSLSAWSRLNLLPLPERSFVLLLLGSCLFPAVLTLYAEWLDVEGLTLPGRLGQHPMALWMLACALSLSGCLLLEPPRGVSPRAYVAQLRARLQQVQVTYAASVRPKQEQHHEVESSEAS